jgi:hypothetical protein
LLLNIEKLIYGGDGLARLARRLLADAAKRLHPLRSRRRKIEAALTEEKPGFARAQATAIIGTFSRTAFRRTVLISAAAADATTSTPPTSINSKSRKKSCARACAASPSSNCNAKSRSIPRRRGTIAIARACKCAPAPIFAIGYFKFASHELLPVEALSHQLAADQSRHRIPVASFGRAGKVVEGVREVEFFANADDSPPADRTSLRP